jgi:hypothetical protein
MKVVSFAPRQIYLQEYTPVLLPLEDEGGSEGKIFVFLTAIQLRSSSLKRVN